MLWLNLKGILLIKGLKRTIFEVIANTSEPTMELINIKLMIFKHYQVDVKKIKCPFQWREKMRTCFL